MEPSKPRRSRLLTTISVVESVNAPPPDAAEILLSALSPDELVTALRGAVREPSAAPQASDAAPAPPRADGPREPEKRRRPRLLTHITEITSVNEPPPDALERWLGVLTRLDLIAAVQAATRAPDEPAPPLTLTDHQQVVLEGLSAYRPKDRCSSIRKSLGPRRNS